MKNENIISEDWVNIQPSDTRTYIENQTAVEEFITHFYPYNADQLELVHTENPNDTGNIVLPALNSQCDITIERFQKRILKTQNKSLVGYLHSSKVNSDSNLRPTLQVIWRGTNFLDPKSIALNLEKGGAVAKTWGKEEKSIMSQIATQIQETYNSAKKPIQLMIGGHSQGGASSQLTSFSLLALLIYPKLTKKSPLTPEEQSVKDTIEKHVSKDLLTQIQNKDFYLDTSMIDQITLVENSSTGINHEKQQAFNQLLRFLNKLPEKTPPVKIHILKRHGDGVTQTGETNLGVGLTSEDAEVRLLNGKTGYKKYALKYGVLAAATTLPLLGPMGAIFASLSAYLAAGAVSTKKAHCGHQFSSALSDVTFKIQPYELVENDTPTGTNRIDKSLGKKSWLVNNLLWGYHKLSDATKGFFPKRYKKSQKAPLKA